MFVANKSIMKSTCFSEGALEVVLLRLGSQNTMGIMEDRSNEHGSE